MNHLKLKKRQLKTEPALILAGFGTTSNSNIIYEKFHQAVQERYPSMRCLIAYTSEIVRAKTGLGSIHECLATLEKEGYRKAIVLPLHIFPATEYRLLCSLCESYPEMRLSVAETLAHRWPYIEDIFTTFENDFLTPETGLNLVIGHGSPLAAEPANIVYLGMETYCQKMYDNVLFATIDGIPSMEMMLRQIRKGDFTGKKARIIPMTITSGKHVKDDLLEGDESLNHQLVELGFEVNWLSQEVDGQTFTKCLGFYPEIIAMFVDRIERSLQLIEIY